MGRWRLAPGCTPSRPWPTAAMATTIGDSRPRARAWGRGDVERTPTRATRRAVRAAQRVQITVGETAEPSVATGTFDTRIGTKRKTPADEAGVSAEQVVGHLGIEPRANGLRTQGPGHETTGDSAQTGPLRDQLVAVAQRVLATVASGQQPAPADAAALVAAGFMVASDLARAVVEADPRFAVMRMVELAAQLGHRPARAEVTHPDERVTAEL